MGLSKELNDMACVFLGLGSNIGERATHLRAALEYLSLDAVLTSIKCSDVFMSEALLDDDAPKAWNMPFYNMVVQGECRLNPDELLMRLKAIEARMGRVKEGHWSPRIIDIDILLYDDVISRSDSLVIPHPYMHLRDFVLIPLQQLSSETIHPALKQTVEQLVEVLQSNTIQRVGAIHDI